MKRLGMLILVPFFLASLSISEVWAQGPGFGGRGGRNGGMQGGPSSPLMDALDTDKDGVLSSDEIANAVAALKALDKDSNGKLTADELRPRFANSGGRGQGGESSPMAQQMVNRLMTLDTNGDEMLSTDEIPQRMLAQLARGDTNQDGYLSEQELLALAEQQTSRRQQERGRRGGPGGGRGGRAGF